MVLDSLVAEVFRRSLAAIRVHGQLVTLLDPGNHIVWEEARVPNLGIHFMLMVMLTPLLTDLPKSRAHQIAILQHCADLVTIGKLTPHAAADLPLAETARAHALIEAGHIQGKLVLFP